RLGDPVHDLAIAVGVVDGHDVLQDRGAALQSEAGVDVLLRKRRERAVGALLVRHEDEVPELEKASAARARRCAVRLAAAVLLSPVVIELRVGPTRARTPDGPEVLRRRQRDDPLCRHPDLLPELDRDLVRAEPKWRISGVDGRPDSIPVELHVLGDELARELDRPLLEVLPEREVAEHLEEREVVPVEADLVDVDCPKDLLREGRQKRGRRLLAEEERHLRLHSRCDEERRVVIRARDERVRRATEMAPFLEEREEALTQLGGRAHPGILRAGSQAAGRGYAAGGGLSCSACAALRSSSSSSLSRRAAASFATRTASPASCRARKADTPCDRPEAKPLTFFTGVVIAVDTARTAVSALSAIETALSVTV